MYSKLIFCSVTSVDLSKAFDAINHSLLLFYTCLGTDVLLPVLPPFLVSTWYRPPSSSQDIFSRFEILVDKIDSENNDFYLLGDLNCDMLHNRSNYHISSNLTNIFDIYGLSQMISEPTRITSTSRTLIDLCITNSPEKIVNSGVVHLGISDHSLVFMTTKIRYEPVGTHRTIETRDYKKIVQLPCELISLEPNPTAMWDEWKTLFMEITDKHAPLKTKRISKKHSPWITYDLMRKIYKRNYLKTKAIIENNAARWEQYKQARNETNNAIKSAKRQYFLHNLELNKENSSKTWKLTRRYGAYTSASWLWN